MPDADTARTIIFCRCANAGVVPAETRAAVAAALAGRAGVTVVDDLCGCLASRDQRAAEWAAADRLAVVACHPRAVRWMFRWAGAPLDEIRVCFLNMRGQSASDIVAGLGDVEASAPALAESAGAEMAEEWPPWFPVIDYVRCTQCRQCLSFCLFGVYALSQEGRVVVENPRACKNNCPACARICPEVAIMFPKLSDAEDPLNGAEITDETNLKARARIDAHELLGDNVYAALAARRAEARKRRLKRDQGPETGDRGAHER